MIFNVMFAIGVIATTNLNVVLQNTTLSNFDVGVFIMSFRDGETFKHLKYQNCIILYKQESGQNQLAILH